MQSKNYSIGLIETGGTISTAPVDGYLSAGRVELAKRFPEIPFAFSEKPVTVLSENETFSDINKICDCVESCANRGVNGIIVTHGTDSLTFFAAAAALMLAGIKIPVVIVSADLPLENPMSNGRDNMLGAYSFIKTAPAGGVYVSYKNRGEKAKIFHGARLNFARGFDGYVSGNEGSAEKDPAKTNSEKIDKRFTGLRLCADEDNKVRFVVPYLGIDYIALSRAAKADGAEIVHDSFHSGTVKTDGENSINALEVPVYLAGKTGDSAYESEKYLGKNVRAYKNITPVALYFKVVLSQGMDADLREKYLLSDVAGEYF